MKQAHWLLFAAALALVPSTAFAQKGKKPKGGGTTTTAPAGGAAGGGEIDLDQPQAGQQPQQPDQGAQQPQQPTGATPAAGGGEGGICEIDPTACPKMENIAEAAKKKYKQDIYAVQQIYVLRYHRVELTPYWGFTLNDQFVSHSGPGLNANFYITNVFAIGLNGNFYSGLNSDSDFNFQTRRATRVAVPLNEYSWSAALNFTYVPVYGKFAGFGSFIFSYDLYATGGVGAISTRPIPVIDPDNRKFDFDPKVCFNLGIGLRVFVTRWLAITAEIRDYIYPEKLEKLTIANGPIGNPNDPNSPSNPKTWLEDGVDITNNFQANVGLSFFLPFSFEYRLPK
ncbi:MAG TPA: outer membrane beta-barrel domain-containing protein [Polyangiaceae bacterium]|jgi:outer membrane beta-barrel protein